MTQYERFLPTYIFTKIIQTYIFYMFLLQQSNLRNFNFHLANISILFLVCSMNTCFNYLVNILLLNLISDFIIAVFTVVILLVSITMSLYFWYVLTNISVLLLMLSHSEPMPTTMLKVSHVCITFIIPSLFLIYWTNCLM